MTSKNSKFLRTARFFIFLTFAFCLLPFAFARSAFAASLSLYPASGIQRVGDVFNVDVILDTGTDAVSGATAIIKYDTARLSVQDDDSNTAGIQIKQGAIFNQTPLTNTVDATTGQIRYDSGSLGSSYTGRGTMATIRFRALAVGTAKVTFVFDAASTIDTSLVAAASGPSNLLIQVQDGNYTINLATGSATPPPMVVYPTGAVENTLVVLVGGLLLVGAGVFFGRKAITS